MNQSRANLLPVAGLMLAMILWASSFIALKIAFKSFDPMVVIFGRMLIASICFLFFIGRFRKIRFKREHLKYLIFMAACEPCIYFVFEAKALANTTASQAGMITSMLPLMVAVTASIYLKENISRRTYMGFGLAILGACLLSVSGVSTENAPNPLLGNFYEFLAMVCATGYTIALKKLSDHYPPLFLTAVQAFVGCIFFSYFLFLPSTPLPTTFEFTPTVAVLYLGTCITLGAYGLYNYGVSRIPAGQASAFVNLIPVFTIFLGWLILDEKFTGVQYVASAMVFAGVILSQKR